MFAGYSADPALMPERFQQRIGSSGLGRTVCDYLSGMTDRFAGREFERLFASRGRD